MGICKREGCDDDTVTVQLVRLDPCETLDGHCRAHHVDDRLQAGRLVAAEVVTNRAKIMSVDGTENRRGDQVAFDVDEIDVDLLVKLGFVKVLGELTAPLQDEPAGDDQVAGDEVAAAAATAKTRRTARG